MINFRLSKLSKVQAEKVSYGKCNSKCKNVDVLFVESS